jgi:hypothetical protein
MEERILEKVEKLNNSNGYLVKIKGMRGLRKRRLRPQEEYSRRFRENIKIGFYNFYNSFHFDYRMYNRMISLKKVKVMIKHFIDEELDCEIKLNEKFHLYSSDFNITIIMRFEESKFHLITAIDDLHKKEGYQLLEV